MTFITEQRASVFIDADNFSGKNLLSQVGRFCRDVGFISIDEVFIASTITEEDFQQKSDGVLELVSESFVDSYRRIPKIKRIFARGKQAADAEIQNEIWTFCESPYQKALILLTSDIDIIQFLRSAKRRKPEIRAVVCSTSSGAHQKKKKGKRIRKTCADATRINFEEVTNSDARSYSFNELSAVQGQLMPLQTHGYELKRPEGFHRDIKRIFTKEELLSYILILKVLMTGGSTLLFSEFGINCFIKAINLSEASADWFLQAHKVPDGSLFKLKRKSRLERFALEIISQKIFNKIDWEMVQKACRDTKTKSLYPLKVGISTEYCLVGNQDEESPVVFGFEAKNHFGYAIQCFGVWAVYNGEKIFRYGEKMSSFRRAVSLLKSFDDSQQLSVV